MLDISEVIIYLRKSRSDDPSKTVQEVLQTHEYLLQEYSMKEFGCKVPETQIFREIVSGETIADRPMMKTVLQLIESNEIKAVLVVEPQRLSRGDLVDCGTIINSFRYSSTLIMTPSKTYNLADEYDRKFMEMELMRGNDYLEYTKKILKRGKEAAARQGMYVGASAPFGYEKIRIGTGRNTTSTLKVVPAEAEIVKLIFHLYVDEGYGFSKIVHTVEPLGVKPRRVDHWGVSTVRCMLDNPTYIGKIRWNFQLSSRVLKDGQIKKMRTTQTDESEYIYVDGQHEAIIDETTFQEAQIKKGNNPCLNMQNKLTNPFAGLVKCGTCGKMMICRSYPKRNHYKALVCGQQQFCHTQSINYVPFEERVIASLEENIADFEVKLGQSEVNSEEIQKALIKNLENEIERLKQKDIRQKDAFEDGIYTKEEYLGRNASLQKQIQDANVKLANMQKNIPQHIDYQEKIIRFSKCVEALKNPDVSASAKNSLLKDCIEKIVYFNDNPSNVGVGRWGKHSFNLQIFLKF